MSNLFEELSKRRVIRVAGMYAIAGWLIIEVGMALETTLNLPGWFDTVVTVLVLIGLPIALILAWAFDITPDGIKRASETDSDASEIKSGARWLDITIIAALVALSGTVFWQSTRQTSPPTTTETTATAEQASASTPTIEEEQSIAVLPFEALSTNQDDAFFGKGISEELLNSLAQFPELKVAARTSAFSFAGTTIDLREVGEQLGVAHLLEGSVRRSGERLRITAQLIRASDGFHLWSETYDRKLTDVFAIQDEIVAELSQVLQFRLGVGAGAGRASSTTASPQAYETYLKGLDLWWERDTQPNSRSDAIATFLRTTELDPSFADGWAAYATSMALSAPGNSRHVTTDELPPAVRGAFAKALELQPDNTRALAGLVYWHTTTDLDIDKAKGYLDRAVALAPNDAFVQYIAAQYAMTVGDWSAMSRAMQRSLAADPFNETKQRVAFTYDALAGAYTPDSAFYQREMDAANACGEIEDCRGSAFGILGNYIFPSAIQAGSDKDLADAYGAAQRVADALGEDDASAFRCYIDELKQVYLAAMEPTCIAVNEDGSLTNTDMFFGGLFEISLLAKLGLTEQAIALLVDKYTLDFGLQSTTNFFTLTDSKWQMPESIRRHPRYHEWWSRPGYAELAEARRVNGKPEGLPLPIN